MVRCSLIRGSPSWIICHFSPQKTKDTVGLQLKLLYVTLFYIVCPSWQSFSVRTAKSLQLQQEACCHREGDRQEPLVVSLWECLQVATKHSPGRADTWKSCQNIPTQIWKSEPLFSSLQFLLQQVQPTAEKMPIMPLKWWEKVSQRRECLGESSFWGRSHLFCYLYLNWETKLGKTGSCESVCVCESTFDI